MALTRKMLKGLDIEAETIDKIISEHMETVEALKDEVSELKDNSKDYDTLKKEYDNYKKNHADNDTSAKEWEKKYNDEHTAFEAYKKDIEGKESIAKVKEAYTQLLKENKVDDKRINSILRITDFKDIKLDDEGKLVDSDKLTETIKNEWGGFIVESDTTGTQKKKPLGGGAGSMTKEDIEKIKDPIERQAKMKENYKLFVE